MNFLMVVRFTKHIRATLICMMTSLFIIQFLFAQPLSYQANVYSKNSGGYFFLNTFKIGEDSLRTKSYFLILDSKGHTVYYKKSIEPSDFKMHPNGLISYYTAGGFCLLDPAFTVVDTLRCMGGIYTDAHDFRILPNGHYLMLGWEKANMDLSKYRFKKNKIPGSSNALVQCGVIQELDKNKKIIFEWHAKDHFQFDDISSFYLWDTAEVDWTHFNSISHDRDGNYLVSSKHFSEITKISFRDSSVLWRMGGKRNQFRFTNDSLPFCTQHDVIRIPNGHILFFDNGFSDSIHAHFSRALEYGIDEAGKTASLKWNYIRWPFIYSVANGNVQRLRNGNTLVNFGKVRRENIMLEVIDRKGKKVFDLKFADTLASLRVYYYPALPRRMKRPVIHNFCSGKEYYLDAGKGYSSYRWSNGDTTQMIRIHSTGKYYVYVPAGQGGYISSEIFEVRKQPALHNKDL